MPNYNSKRRYISGNVHFNPEKGRLAPDEDIMMEQILENIHTTPIGQLLQKIASLPEVRQEKILDVRQQLTEGRYDLNGRLDLAIDRVLENLTS
ncbi:MAG: flagellar biosynthesis anti-sigma factor FlgM [Sedimentisphaerales bacterium]|nr:flagellar biosynthesis anti-sigma factor FlgM [Sedimentisphaerales bacterium]